MRALLILLTLTVVLVALFSGGCSVMAVGDFLWNGPRMYFDETVAWIVAGVGLVAAAVLAANLWMLRALLKMQVPRGRWMSKGVLLVLTLLDLGAALLSVGLLSLYGSDSYEVGWLLAAVVFVAFAAKGVLTLRWVASAPAAGSSGPPSSR
jgi:hypothetical protein